MLDNIVSRDRGRVAKRLWIISDLQQRLPDNAEKCMTAAVDDFLSLALSVDGICYLGDSVEGTDIDYINRMSQMQVKQLGRINAPKYYVVGNHDYEYFRFHQINSGMTQIEIPFCDAIRALPGWHVQKSVDTFYYKQDFGLFVAFFFPDHGDPKGGKWHTTNGEVWGEKELYTKTEDDFAAVREEIAQSGKPAFTFSHYSFLGGNRESPLLSRFLPLPDNVRMHFYGHAHIGDAKWAGKDCYRKIAAIDNQKIIQVNCASLENLRGSAIRSVIFEYYDNGDVGLFFRNHTLRKWDEMFFQSYP